MNAVENYEGATTRPMVQVIDAHKSFGSVEILKGINLSVEKGQIVAIIGPSGSGKSTLLRSINHLEKLDKGEVWVDGVLVNRPLGGRAFEQHINKVRQRMGMVFQQFNLFPHMTVGENVTAGPDQAAENDGRASPRSCHGAAG